MQGLDNVCVGVTISLHRQCPNPRVWGVGEGVAYCIDNFSKTAGRANFIFVIYTTAQTHTPKPFVPDDP